MSSDKTVVALAEVAELNPRLDVKIRPDEQVAFVPMAAVTETTGDIVREELRTYADVARGFTPFKSDDVIVAKITPCFQNGKIAHARLSTRWGFGSTEFHVVRANHERLIARYAFHFLRQNHIRAAGERRMTGSAGQRRVPEDYLARLQIPLPPLSEQKRIAEILDRAEALRAKRRAALALLDDLTQSIFLDMFGDPVTNLRGWETIQFHQLCTRVTVGIVVKPASYYANEGVPALRSLNVRPGKIVQNDMVYVSAHDNEVKLKKTMLNKGDLVLVRSGQPGTCAVIPQELSGANAIDLLIATPKAEVTDSTYLCEFFNSSGGRRLVLSKQRGQIQKHLNVGVLNEAMIPSPPLKIQREFSTRIVQIERLKKSLGRSLAKLDAYFASLQHRAFRGDL